MQLGARVSFDQVDELESHFEGVDFPVELALPYRVHEFLPIAGRMAEVLDFIRGKGIQVQSIHAAQGNLAADDCFAWAQPALWLADELGARCVTFHPSQTNRDQRLNAQTLAKRHLRQLQRDHQAVAAIETFGGSRRIFHPEEIVQFGLPMVLDTAHLHEDERILKLIKDYHRSIPTVHLSARGDGEHHLPVDAFCLDVVALLSDLDWGGGVILEYLPWHHYRVRDDLAILRRFLDGEKQIEITPPDARFRNDETRWGFEWPREPLR